MMSDLRTLVEVALQRFGCHVEVVQENLFRTAIPAGSPMRQTLDVDETAYLALVQIADDDLVGLDPIRYLVPGSIYLERFIGGLTEHGAVGDVTLAAVFDRPNERIVKASLTSAMPDGYEIASGEVLAHRCVTFHFIVDLFAIEASKTLVSITFDFDSRRLIENLDAGELLDAKPALVQIAETELKAAAGAVLESVRVEACRRIDSYAAEHGSERVSARKQLKKLAKEQLAAISQAAQARGAPFGEGQDEIARDWEHRMRHADNQYRAEGAQITLVGATRQLRYFARYPICFPARPAADDSWDVFYDLTCGNFLVPMCHTCGSEVGRLTIGDGLCSHPLCEHCAETVPTCGHRACKACLLKCAACTVTMCLGCNSECGHDNCLSSDSLLGLCDKHKRQCGKCEVCVCSRHRLFCKSCQRTFCSICYEVHQWKKADCGHWLDCGSKPKVCRTCAHTVCPLCTEQCWQCSRYTCNKHSVKCNVCSSSLCDKHTAVCSQCENSICSRHRQYCRSCKQTLCTLCYPNHGWRPVDCGHQISCRSKASVCRFCNCSLCIACTAQCKHCRRFICRKHADRCLGCGLQICQWCARFECHVCGAQCCREHSFSCKVCARNLCHHDVEWCAVCKRSVCSAHVKRCASCLSSLCPKHGREAFADLYAVIHCVICEGEKDASLLSCDHCQTRVPPALLARCSDSDQLICLGCGAKCSECHNWSLEFEFGKCVGCGIILCDDCLGEHADRCESWQRIPTLAMLQVDDRHRPT
jgi:hypothetical protein